MRSTVRLGLGSLFASLLMVSACGGQVGAPQYVEVFGGIDLPCGIGSGSSDAVQHCIAHVVLANHGGEGIGHVTLIVPIKDAKGGSETVPPALCGTSVPDLPGGGAVDLSCSFDLQPGKVVANYPGVQSIDYAAATSAPSSGFDLTGIVTLVLSFATVVLAVTMLVALRGRGPAPVGESAPGNAPDETAGSPTTEEARQPARVATSQSRGSERRSAVDAEYDLPQLPR